MTIRFFLKSDKKALVPVWVRVKSGKDFDLSISLPKAAISPDLWDSKHNEPKAFNKTTQRDLYDKATAISKYLQSVKDNIVEAVDACKEREEPFTSEHLKKIAEKELSSGIEKDKAPRDMVKYCLWLIERMEDGRFRFNNTRQYDKDTIKTWKVFCRVLKDFREWYEAKANPLTWNAIDATTFVEFLTYLEGRGFTVKTINKHIICLKALIRYACSIHHLHDNLSCLDSIHRKKEDEGSSTTKIYLNEKEVQALYEMPMEPGSLKDKVRDLFLVGCYTCQRVSDYNHISKSNFGTTARGTKVIRLIQEKTGIPVVIPILNDNLEAIAKKYDYNLPTVNDVIINRYIKDICKELSKVIPSLAEPIKTILTLPERRAEEEGRLCFDRDEKGNTYKPKYDCVCSHTARRSGITNLYCSGNFSELQLMSISGHKTAAHFYLYIRQSSDELADEIDRIRKEAEKGNEASNESLF